MPALAASPRVIGQGPSSAPTPIGFGPSGCVIVLRRARDRPDRRAVFRVVIVRLPYERQSPRARSRTAPSVQRAAPGRHVCRRRGQKRRSLNRRPVRHDIRGPRILAAYRSVTPIGVMRGGLSRLLDNRITDAGGGRTQSKSSACLRPAGRDYALPMFDLGRTFLAAVERSPDATAIVDAERRLGYASWYEEIARVAGGLTALGLRRGDRLAVILQNRLEMASLHWACQFAGIVVTPLNWRIKPKELDYCLADADAAAIVFDDVAADSVAGAGAAQRLPRIAIGNIDGATCRFKD